MRRANVTRIDTDLCCALQVGPLRVLTVHQLRPAGCAGQASLFLCINQVSTRSLTHREPFDFRSVPTTTTDIDTRTCVYVRGFDSPTCRKLVRFPRSIDAYFQRSAVFTLQRVRQRTFSFDTFPNDRTIPG